MTTDRDPPRLHETSDVEAGVRHVLRAGKDEAPDAARMDHILSGLRSKIGSPSGDGGPETQGAGSGGASGPSPGPGATKASLSGVTKIAATAIGAGAIGVLILTTRDQSPVDTTAPAPTASTSAAPPLPRPTPAAPASAPPAPPIVDVPAIPIDLLPSTPLAPSSARTASSSAAGPAPSELTLLKEAQGALANEPARSLDIVAKHERTFPKAEFSEEREVIRIDALMRLGRVEEAHARADGFNARFPASAHRARVRALLAK